MVYTVSSPPLSSCCPLAGCFGFGCGSLFSDLVSHLPLPVVLCRGTLEVLLAFAPGARGDLLDCVGRQAALGSSVRGARASTLTLDSRSQAVVALVCAWEQGWRHSLVSIFPGSLSERAHFSALLNSSSEHLILIVGDSAVHSGPSLCRFRLFALAVFSFWLTGGQGGSSGGDCLWKGKVPR